MFKVGDIIKHKRYNTSIYRIVSYDENKKLYTVQSLNDKLEYKMTDIALTEENYMLLVTEKTSQLKVGDKVELQTNLSWGNQKLNKTDTGIIEYIFTHKDCAGTKELAIIQWDNGYKFTSSLDNLTKLPDYKFKIGTKLKKKNNDDRIYTIVDQMKSHTNEFFNILEFPNSANGITWNTQVPCSENTINDHYDEVKE